MSDDIFPADLNDLDFEALKNEVLGQPDEDVDFNLAVKAFRVASKRVDEAKVEWERCQDALAAAESALKEQQKYARAILVRMSEAIGVDLANIKD